MAYLLKYLKEHGIEAREAEGGKILALAHYSKDGEGFSRWETIEPSIVAVRAWLGY